VNPILQFQNDFYSKLIAEPLLANVNVVKLRELQLLSDTEVARAWLKARNGKSGAGIIVGMPSLEHEAPNVDGPERKMLIPISVLEQPSVNALSSTGTGLTAEEIVDYIDALIARLGIERLGSVYCEATIPNLEAKSGVIRYDMVFTCVNSRTPIEQVPVPTVGVVGQTITLTNHASYPTAKIYYTTDGTFPGPDAVTGLAAGTSTLYSVPFTPAVGTVVRWAAYQTSLRGSDVGQGTVT